MIDPIIVDNYSRRNEFIKMLAAREVRFGVEVGTDHGKYGEQLCAGIPGLRLTCVDPWIPYTEGTNVHTQEEIDQIYKEAQDRLTKYDTKIMKMTSMEAVRFVPDNSLDFVFIDGNHSYKNVKEDIEEWTKKVKPGGIICGHDYKEDKVNDYGVIEAVNEYVEANHISPFFILRKRGLVDCYMWIKQ